MAHYSNTKLEQVRYLALNKRLVLQRSNGKGFVLIS